MEKEPEKEIETNDFNQIFSFFDGEKIKYQKFSFENFFKKNFRLGQHGLILGGTGTGKTNWLINFFKYCPHKIIFFNTIGIIEIEKNADIVISEKDTYRINRFLSDTRINKICITPSDRIIVKEKGLFLVWNDLCKKIYDFEDIIYTKLMQRKGRVKNRDFVRRANIVIVIDELMYVCIDEKLLSNHKALLTRGRNYKISHIGASQRNQNISKIITTQSFHKVILALDDFDINALRKKVAHVEKSINLKEFAFIYFNQRNKSPKFYKPVKLELYE